MRKGLIIVALALLAWGTGAGTIWADDGVDSDIYKGLLAAYVGSGGEVDYQGLKLREAELDAYLDVLRATDPQTLSHNARFAFWINVYNAFTLKLILTDYPGISSINDIGGFLSSPWKRRFITIAGQEPLHLDNVEKDILIPEFKDPRVHFAINCASKSCPPLMPEPFDGLRLEAQLNERAALFINDGRNVTVRDGELLLSRIFKWYGDDFGDVAGYVARYATGALAEDLRSLGAKPRILFLEYDWSLNGT
ncbi:MAG: DUF547 domain-containing protein [Proteobacteria bacterium]|nr:DUF547 domain-containing protein [Pseudomonadota bacterium]